MGLMTGLAIGGLVGALAAQKLKKKKPGETTPPAVAPPPSNITDQTAQPPIVDPGKDQAAATLAGEKARTRAALGGLAMRGGVPRATTPIKPITTRPKTLIGGY